MRTGAHGTSRLAYPGTLAMLALALAFPIALMVFNPTLMFERGWEQYVGTAIYFWAVLTLGRELRPALDERARLRRGPRPARPAHDAGAPAAERLARADRADDGRILPARIRQLAHYLDGSRTPSVGQLMEINREGSGLDQEHVAGRFTLTRYILYLLPVIGFIGTVEGISKALMNISLVLPMVKDLDGFMGNLTSVTSALQIAFDSTLLALFLSAALMLVQTLVFRRSEDLLARVDRWVVEQVLPRFGADEASGAGGRATARSSTQLRRELAAVLEKFAATVERLPASLAASSAGPRRSAGSAPTWRRSARRRESLRRGVASLGRIETVARRQHGPDRAPRSRSSAASTATARPSRPWPTRWRTPSSASNRASRSSSPAR